MNGTIKPPAISTKRWLESGILMVSGLMVIPSSSAAAWGDNGSFREQEHGWMIVVLFVNSSMVKESSSVKEPDCIGFQYSKP